MSDKPQQEVEITVKFTSRYGGMFTARYGSVKGTSTSMAETAAQRVAIKLLYGSVPPWPGWKKTGIRLDRIYRNGSDSSFRAIFPAGKTIVLEKGAQ